MFFQQGRELVEFGDFGAAKAEFDVPAAHGDEGPLALRFASSGGFADAAAQLCVAVGQGVALAFEIVRGSFEVVRRFLRLRECGLGVV